MIDMPKHSVDLICCDLPFGITNSRGDVCLDFEKLWCGYEHALKPTGTVVLFGAGMFTAKLCLSNEKWFKYRLVWDKNKCGSPGLANIRPMMTHEDICVFAPGKTVYNPQMTEGEPYSRKSSSPEGYVGKENRHGYGLKPRTEFTNTGTRYPKSVLRMPRDFSAQQQVHPAQKPVTLMTWLILTYSNLGDVVLDNCMGSASTGLGALQCGRHFVGIEKDPEYFATAKERMDECQ
jgi:hypothetical protein